MTTASPEKDFMPRLGRCSRIAALAAVSLLLSGCAGLVETARPVSIPLDASAVMAPSVQVSGAMQPASASTVVAPEPLQVAQVAQVARVTQVQAAASTEPAPTAAAAAAPVAEGIKLAAETIQQKTEQLVQPQVQPQVRLQVQPQVQVPLRSQADIPAVQPQAELETVTSLPAGSSQPVAATEAPRELWDRIRRGYAMPDLQNDLVKQHERFYTSRPEYLQRMVERSRKYLFHIVEELELRNMPAELALLPFVESAFNPQAVSSARAAGMWQFMPATGRSFDLKQNIFRDDRRDVLASTRAALDYLQKLYGMFGDWHLALAAYNWGEGSVGRAIARNQRLGLGTGYQDLSMPNETRNYVPKLQALKNIVALPQGFNAELPVIDNHPYFQDVEIRRDIDVALAAKLADIRIEDFKALNPSANRPIIVAAGNGKILLPWDNAEVFKRNLEAHSAGHLASWTAWQVPSTMSAADAARRVGMSESELRTLNNIPARMLIKAGSTLVVSRSPNMQDDVSNHQADNGALSLAPEVALRKTTVKARKGDTVELMARRHRVSSESLAQWNRVAVSASFKAGESVLLFLPAKAGAASSGKAQKRPAAAASPRPTPQKATAQKRPSSNDKKAEGKR